jgi:hypothetical protein
MQLPLLPTTLREHLFKGLKSLGNPSSQKHQGMKKNGPESLEVSNNCKSKISL